MKTNMLKQIVLTFTVIAFFAVSALAQAVPYKPTGAVIAQANQAPKPTPTPANAQFIVAPKETTIDVPAQKLTVKMSDVATGGASGSVSELEKQLRAELNGVATQAEKAAGSAKSANNAVAGLRSELEAEKTAREQGDQGLQSQVDAVKTDITGLTNSLTLEADNRKAEDTKLGTRVTNIEKERSYGNIALGLAILALLGLIIMVIWVSKRKPTTVIQHQPANPNEAGSGGTGGTPANDPPSGGGSDPATPMKLGTKPATTPAPETTPKPTPASEPKLNFNRDLTDEEKRWFKRAQNLWAEYREEGREGNFQRSILKNRIIDPPKFEVLKKAIEREEAKIARNAKPAVERPVFNRQPAQAEEKPAEAQPANEAEANDGDVKTIATPSPNAQAKAASSGTDA